MNVLDKLYVITLANGDRWAVPVRVIAENRAAYFAEEDGLSREEALGETEREFMFDDGYEIKDWAASNMNWEDVKAYAVFYAKSAIDADADPFQEAWRDIDKAEVVDPK